MVGLALIGSVAYARKVEPDQVHIDRITAVLEHLDPTLHGFRILQLSDIHMDGRWMNFERLEEWVQIANREKPDLIVITGDVVSDGFPVDIKEYAKILVRLEARHGKLAVMGNHDYRMDVEKTRRILNQSEIRELCNAVHSIRQDGGVIHIAGVDDVLEGMPRLEETLGQIPEQGAAVLLVHEPDFADAGVESGRFDLQISGHSHGGQVIIPGLGPIVLPPLGRKYPIGLRKIGNMLQYTNRGLGMVAPYVRFFCPPEITIFTLERKTPAG